MRESRSLKLEDVAGRLGVAPSTLSRIETGKAPTRMSYLTVLLELYRVRDPAQRRVLADLAREGQHKGWWADCDDVLPASTGSYLGLEAEAAALAAFQAQVVHGLLQTQDYARAVIRASRPDLAAAQVERLTGVQIRRQEVLRGSVPLQLRLVIDEAVLLRQLGSAQVMSHQLARLLAASSLPAVTVRVLPLAGAGQPVLSASFAILSFAEPGDTDVVCTEGSRGQMLLTERESELRAMRATFGALSREALPAAESADLIRALARKLDA